MATPTAQPTTLNFASMLQPVQQDPQLTQAYQALMAQEMQPVQYQGPTQPSDIINAMGSAYNAPNAKGQPSKDVMGAIASGVGGLANYGASSAGEGIMALLSNNPYYRQAWAQQAQGTKGLEMQRAGIAAEAEKNRREQLGTLLPKVMEQNTAAQSAINTSRKNFVDMLQTNQRLGLDEKKILFDAEDAQVKNAIARHGQDLTSAQQEIDAIHNQAQYLIDATKDMRPDERISLINEYHRTGQLPEVLRKGFHPFAGYSIQRSTSGAGGARVAGGM